MSSSSETSSVASDSSDANSDAGAQEQLAVPTPVTLSKPDQRALLNRSHIKIVRAYKRTEKFSHREEAHFDRRVLEMKLKRIASRKLNPFNLSKKQQRSVDYYVNASLAKLVKNNEMDVEMFGCEPVVE